MIELARYESAKAEKCAWAEPGEGYGADGQPTLGVYVFFKRFDVRNGKELDPERSFVPFALLDEELKALTLKTEAVLELLRLKPK